MSLHLVTAAEAQAALGIKKTTFYVLKRYHKSLFPQPVKTKGRLNFYDLDALRAFVSVVAPRFLKAEAE